MKIEILLLLFQGPPGDRGRPGQQGQQGMQVCQRLYNKKHHELAFQKMTDEHFSN